ncbi:DNA-directed RNA polymerases II and IV subunit 5A [Dionaea muscipula]
MAMSEEDISRLYRVRKTVMEMLNDRGYFVADMEINMTKEQFIDNFGENMKREDLVLLKEMRDNKDEKIYVFFPEEEKVGVKTIRNYTNRMNSENVSRAILVIAKKVTNSAKACLGVVQSQCYLETFLESELLVNVTKHVLVPEHQPLTEVEKKALLEKYTVKETQLPRMLQTDAVAKYYGLKRGHVVKIIRPSETAGRYVTYRYVV